MSQSGNKEGKLKRVICDEGAFLKEIVFNELKTLLIIIIYVFFLILFKIYSINNICDILNPSKLKFQETLEYYWGEIINWHMLWSILLTGFIISVIKVKIYKRNSDYIYINEYVSISFLNFIAAISLFGLGVSILACIFLQIFYPYLDGGKLSESISREKIFILFSIVAAYSSWVCLVCRYLHEKIKYLRSLIKEKNKDAACSLLGVSAAVFIIIFLVFFIPIIYFDAILGSCIGKRKIRNLLPIQPNKQRS